MQPPKRSLRSSTHTRHPPFASSAAHASELTPLPTTTASYSAIGVDDRIHVAARAQDAHGCDREDLGPLRPRVAPDPLQVLPVESLRRREVRPLLSVVSHTAPEHTPDAEPARRVEEEHGIGAVEASVVAAAEVAVEDPPVACDDGRELGLRLVARR